MQSLKETINKISLLTEKLNDNSLSLEQKASINKELLNLLSVADKLQNLIFLNSHKCIIKNNEISLYQDDDTHIQKYIIVDSNTKDYIGEILYNNTSKDDAEKYGNISYYICKEKRGNHYALKALNLLTDLLYQNGVDKIYIAAKHNNIPSIKTIKTFGGEKTNFSTTTTYVYFCDLKKLKKSTNKNPR